MEFMPAEDAMERLLQKYNRDPKGWRVSIGDDPHGYVDVFVRSPREFWQIKLDSLYKPTPLGTAAKIGGPSNKRKVDEGVPDFGFRPIPEDLFRRLLEPHTRGPDIAAEILRRDPMRLADIRAPAIASGPIGLGANLSKRQGDLDADLRANLRKMLHRRGMEQEFG